MRQVCQNCCVQVNYVVDDEYDKRKAKCDRISDLYGDAGAPAYAPAFAGSVSGGSGPSVALGGKGFTLGVFKSTETDASESIKDQKKVVPPLDRFVIEASLIKREQRAGEN